MPLAKRSLASAIILAVASPAVAQTMDDDMGVATYQPYTGGGMLNGTYFDVRHQTSSGMGYMQGYTQVGALAPLVNDGDIMFAPQARLIITDTSKIGANLGLIARKYDSGRDRIWGANVWYDVDRTTYSNTYNQFGIGVESLGKFLDFRANGYIPFGNQQNVIGPYGISSALFYSGNQINATGIQLNEQSLRGGDFEFGTPIVRSAPWLRGYAGAYFYDGVQKNIPGVRGRIDAQLSSDLLAGVIVTHDNTFSTNVNAYVEWRFSNIRPAAWFPSMATQDRMLTSVQRQWRTSTTTFTSTVAVPVYNTRDNEAYFVTWVDSSNTGSGSGTGTYEDPLHNLPSSSPQADLILVRQGNSATTPYDNSLTLTDYQRLLGTGAIHRIDGYATYAGQIIPLTKTVLPEFTTNDPSKYPTLTSSTGSVVTLANNNEVSGFNIANAVGSGITNTAAGSNNFLLQQLNITGNNTANSATAGGIYLSNAQGTGVIREATVSDNGGYGVRADAAAALGLSLDGVTATGNQLDNLNVSGQSGVPVSVALTSTTGNNSFNDSTAGSGIVMSVNDAVGTLTSDAALAASGNALDGIRLEATNGGTIGTNSLPLNLDSANLSGNGRDALSLVSSGTGSNVSVSGSGVNGSGAGRYGLNVDASGGGTASSTITGSSDFSGAGSNAVNLATTGAASAITSTITGGNFSGAGGDGLFASANGGSITSMVTDSNFSGAAGRGAALATTANGTITSTITGTSATSGSTFAGAGGNALDISGNTGTITSTVTNTNFSEAGGIGANIGALAGANVTSTITDSDFSHAATGGGTGLAMTANASTITSTVTGSAFDNADGVGANINATAASTVNSTITGSTFNDVTGTGLAMTANASTVTSNVTGSEFSRAGGDGTNINAAAGASVTSTVTSSKFDNATGTGLAVASNGTGTAVTSTVTDSDYSSAGVDGVSLATTTNGTINSTITGTDTPTASTFAGAAGNGMTVSANTGTITNNVSNTDFSSAGGDGANIAASGAGNVTTTIADSLFNDAAGTGLNLSATTAGNFNTTVTGASSFANAGVDAVNAVLNAGTGTLTMTGTAGSPIDLSNAARDAVHLDLSNAATLTTTLTDVNGNAGIAGTQNGIVYNVASGSTLNSTVTDSTFNNVAVNGLNGVVTSSPGDTADTTATMLFTDTTFTGAGGDAATFDTNGSTAKQYVKLDTVDLSGSTAGNAMSVSANGGSLFQACIDDANLSGSALAGLKIDVQGAGTVASFGTEGSHYDNNGHEGLVASVTSGGELNFRSLANDANVQTTFDRNGTAGTYDGVNISATGTGSSAHLLFANTSASGNTGNGFNFEATNGAYMTARLDTVTATDNGGYGVQMNASGTGTTGLLLMEGTNTVDNNTAGNYNAVFTNADVSVFSYTGSYNGNAADNGITVSMTGTGTESGLVLINGNGTDTIDGNALDGINITMSNLKSAGISVSGYSSISNNGDDGIDIDLNTIDTAAINLTGATDLIGNGGDAIKITLNNVGLGPMADPTIGNYIVLTRTNNDTSNPLDPDCIPVPIVQNFSNSNGNAPTANGIAIDGMNADGLNTTTGTNGGGIVITGTNVTNAATDAAIAATTGITVKNSSSINSSADGLQISLTNSGTTGSGTQLDPLNIDVNGSTFNDNATNGVNMVLNNTQINTLNVSSNTSIDGNAANGVNVALTGSANVTTLNVNDNTSINGNGADGVNVALTASQAGTLNVSSNTSISNNKGGAGILVDASGGSTVTTTTINSNAAVTGNQTNGIQFNVAGSDFTNPIQIQGNTITNSVTGDGINVVNPTTTSGALGFNITGNTISGMVAGNGINLTSNATDLSGTVIDTNVIQNNALNGINLDLDGVSADDVEIKGNTAISGNGGNGINVALKGGATFNNFLIDTNTINGNTGTTPTAGNGDGIFFDVANGDLGGTFSGNTISDNARDGIRMLAPNTTTNAITFNYNTNTISGNKGVGVDMSATGALQLTQTFTDNIITGNTLQGVNLVAGAVAGDTAAINATFNGDTIDNNLAQGVNLQAVYGAAVNASFTNGTSVSGNTGQGVNLLLNNDATSTLIFNDATISNNKQLAGADGQGINAIVHDNAAVNTTITDSTISDNAGMGAYFLADGAGPIGSDAITLTMAKGAGAGNVVNNNAGAGIAVNLNQADPSLADSKAGATVNISGTKITNTKAGTVSGYNGQGLSLRSNQNSVFNGITIGDTSGTAASNDTWFNGNAGDGIEISLDRTADPASPPPTPTVPTITVQHITASSNGGNGFDLTTRHNADVTNLNIIASTFGGTTTALGNTGDGIHIDREDDSYIRNVMIGGTTAADGNVISNNSDGIDITLTHRNEGTDIETITEDVYSVLNNTIDSNRSRGLSAFLTGDADLRINVDSNKITNSGGDGIQYATNPGTTDSAYLRSTITTNTITGNGGDGIDIAVAHEVTIANNTSISNNTGNGINISGSTVNTNVPLGSGTTFERKRDFIQDNLLMDRNGLNGILITSNGYNAATITGNNITYSGTLSTDPTNANNDGLQINSNGQLVAMVIGNNVIASSSGDAIQYAARNSGQTIGGRNTVSINNNDLRDSGGRGINVLNANADTNMTIGSSSATSNQIRRNKLEGVYVVNTADTTQNVNASATTAMSATGSVTNSPHLNLTFLYNTITANGAINNTANFIDASGFVLRVGTSDGGVNSITDTGGFAGDGRGGVIANVSNNYFQGNYGADVTFQSFVSTVAPTVTNGTWSDNNNNGTNATPPVYTYTDDNFTVNRYYSDPLARLDLTFQNNQLQGWVATQYGAYYNNAEATFKSRGPDGNDLNNDGGPFTSTAGDRQRNAQRLAFRGTGANMLNPSGNDPNGGSNNYGNSAQFLYPGMGASTFRALVSGNTRTPDGNPPGTLISGTGFIFDFANSATYDNINDANGLPTPGPRPDYMPYGWGTLP